MAKIDRIVGRVSSWFRQLRWKLAMTYTVATVGALIAVELLVIIAGLLYFGVNTRITPRLLIQNISTNFVPPVRENLFGAPENINEEVLWLKKLRVMEMGIRSPIALIGNIQLDMRVQSPLDMYFVTSDGTLLETLPTGLVDADMIGQPFDTGLLPGIEKPLEAAFMGEQDYGQLYALNRPGNRFVAAVPVFDEKNEKVLGAIAFASNALPWSLISIRDITLPLAYSILCFTLVAGAMGTLFGSLTARNLVDRLSGLSDSANAWSHGDFSVLVDDPNQDELGHLARDLNSMVQRLENLLDKRQEMSVLEERNRLARDLHDSAKQQAFAASAQLGAARALIMQDPEAAAGHLEEAEALVDEVRQELNYLIQQLRPVSLKGVGLISVLREYAYEWARHNQLNIDVRVQNERSLLLETEQTLFRIAQEALANISRHSGAMNVDLLLVYNTHTVTLAIADDGKGFDITKKHAGLGLHSMRERADLLDGCLIVESDIGQGTRVTAQCPC